MTSEAAYKAWETRRAKQNPVVEKPEPPVKVKAKAKTRAALLRERALKAWETRRANGWVHPASRPKRRRRVNG